MLLTINLLSQTALFRLTLTADALLREEEVLDAFPFSEKEEQWHMEM